MVAAPPPPVLYWGKTGPRPAAAGGRKGRRADAVWPHHPASAPAGHTGPPSPGGADPAFCWDLHRVPLAGREGLLGVNASSRLAFFCWGVGPSSGAISPPLPWGRWGASCRPSASRLGGGALPGPGGAAGLYPHPRPPAGGLFESGGGRPLCHGGPARSRRSAPTPAGRGPQQRVLSGGGLSRTGRPPRPFSRRPGPAVGRCGGQRRGGEICWYRLEGGTPCG